MTCRFDSLDYKKSKRQNDMSFSSLPRIVKYQNDKTAKDVVLSCSFDVVLTKRQTDNKTTTVFHLTYC